MFLPLPESYEQFSKPIIGTIEKPITLTCRGRVMASSSIWYASFYHPDYYVSLARHDPVLVIGRQGITLLVIPIDKDNIAAVYHNAFYHGALSPPSQTQDSSELPNRSLVRLFTFMLLMLTSFAVFSQLPSEITIVSYHSLLFSRLLADTWTVSSHQSQR